MRPLMTILSSLFIFCTASAQNGNSDTIDILAKIQTTPSSSDLCVWISDTNKLVQLGDSAVDTLISVLQSNSYGHIAKWSAALALGEIGNSKAASVLTEVAARNPADSQGFHLGDLSRNAAGKIQGTVKKEGKFRKITYAVQKTVTDCETGKIEVIQ